MEERAYTYSVVMPVYRVERYLAESVESLIAQSIGFEDHIQLVLVNDGSPDDSERICLDYQARFPRNIVYVSQPNAGVSAARNHGLRHVRGRYVSFLDSDDMWEPDAFERAAELFEANPQVRVLAGRMRFFDAVDKPHPTDYKFTGDRVVDIRLEPDYPQLHVTSAIFRAEALAGAAFDERVAYGEDFLFMTGLLMREQRYLVASSVKHRYRRRSAGDSAINFSTKSPTWYLDTPRLVHEALVGQSMALFGEVLPFLQHTLMYDIQWRLKSAPTDAITPAEQAEYRERLAGLLKLIDDDVIWAQREVFTEHKLFALALKRGCDVSEVRRGLAVEGRRVLEGSHEVRCLDDRHRLRIEILERRGSDLIIEGRVNTVLDSSEVSVAFRAAGIEYVAEHVARPDTRKYALGEPVQEAFGFRVTVPLGPSARIVPAVRCRGADTRVVLSFGALAPLNETLAHSHFEAGGHTFTAHPGSLSAHRDPFRVRATAYEIRFLRELVRLGRRDIAAERLRARFARLFGGRKVWLISDFAERAGDNGEAFFAHLVRIRPRGVRPVFVLGQSSPDHGRVQALGRVVEPGSREHRAATLVARYVASSSASGIVGNAFGEDRAMVRDMGMPDFVFLQTGITKDDLSHWLHKYVKNIRIFVTGAPRERDAIVAGDYHYTEREVRLTGLPRFDLLEPAPVQRTVLLMPTWRSSLEPSAKAGARARQPFTASEYFRFYNALTQDERLAAALQAHGYTMEFVVPPRFADRASEFTPAERVRVRSSIGYADAVNTSALLVTDYSSVAFDFAYLGKPVIYTQFDRRSIHRDHIYRPGYFDYDIDGFGPVCESLDVAVDAIVESLEGGCAMPDEYARRAGTFFFRSESPFRANLVKELLAADGRVAGRGRSA